MVSSIFKKKHGLHIKFSFNLFYHTFKSFVMQASGKRCWHHDP